MGVLRGDEWGEPARSAFAHARTVPGDEAGRWLAGARAERDSGRVLGVLGRLRRAVVLHDRAVPGTRANIDHLVVAADGVWVVDTKRWAGTARRSGGDVVVGEHSVAATCGQLRWLAERVAGVLVDAGMGQVGVAVAVSSTSLARRRWLGEAAVGGPPTWLRRRLGLAHGMQRARRLEVARVLDRAFPAYVEVASTPRR